MNYAMNPSVGHNIPSTQSFAVPGGVRRRFVALLLDFFILSVLSWTLTVPIELVGFAMMSPELAIAAQMFSWSIGFVISFFYYGWFYKNKGASPGKLLLGLRVADTITGENLGYWRAFFREVFGHMLSAILFGIGFAMAIFRNDKKTLHDLLFSTQVLRK